MKQINYRNRRKINPINRALMANFTYILMILIFKGIFDASGMGNAGSYNMVFGGIEFAVMSVFLIVFNWISFKDTSIDSNKTYSRFLIHELIPIVVMTILTIAVTYLMNSQSFSAQWNVATFVIAPTLFYYLPYGFLYNFLSMLPLAAFMGICLVYMILLQFIGFLMGSKSRAYAKEREQKRMIQERKIMERQNKMAREAAENTGVISPQPQIDFEKPRLKMEPPKKKTAPVVDPKDPLADVDQPAVIYTEAFTSITDEMIEEAVRNQKIKTAQQKTEERRAAAKGKPGLVQRKKNVSLAKQQKQQKQQKHQTTDLVKELEEIRRKMEQKDEQ